MDFENQTIKANSDIIYEKVTSSIENSTSVLHKKAVVLIKGLKQQIKGDQTKGLNGIKNYTKSLMTLLEEMFIKLGNSIKDEILFDENLKNADALIFCLAVCVKHLPANLIKGGIIPKIISILNNFLSLKRFEIRKYALLIVEKLCLASDVAELKKADDFFVDFLCDFYLDFLSCKHEEIEKLTAKSLSNLFKNKSILEALRYSLVLKIKNFYIAKIRGIKLMKNPTDSSDKITKAGLLGLNIEPIETSLGDQYLKIISLIIQYLPFDAINELICELNDLLENCEESILVKSIFECFDLAFSSKSFAIETSEKIFKNIIGKEIITDLELNEDNHANKKHDINNNDKKNSISFSTSLIISYIKALTSVFANISRTDSLIALKYLPNLISILGEYFSSNDSYVKNNIFNALTLILNQILSQQNLDLFFTKHKAHNGSNAVNNNNNNNIPNEADLNEDEVIEAFNVDLEKTAKFNLKKIYEETVNVIFYLVSDRYDDLKPGFNLLLNFIEKVHIKKYYELTNPLIEDILTRLSENQKLHNKETFKIFIGKAFNYIASSVIIKYFPLQILDYDIFGEEYTEISKVWIISYIERFLKASNELQTIIEFYKSFFETIDGLEIIISKLKNFLAKNKSKKPQLKDNIDVDMENADEDNQMQEDEEELDERFIVEDDTEYNQNLKLKRYELILNNIWELFVKYLNHEKNYAKYIKEIFVKLEKNLSNYPYLKEKIFKCVTRMLTNSFKLNDIESLEVLKCDGKKFFVKAYSTVIHNKFTMNELRESFCLISNFCKICSEKYLKKIICEMIELFEKDLQGLVTVHNPNVQNQGDEISRNSNISKLNEPLQFDEDMRTNNATNSKVSFNINNNLVNAGNKANKNNIDPKGKKISLLCLRVEIINQILKNMKGSENVNSLLNAFFEKFFFNENLNFQNLKKKLIELFITLLDKLNDGEQVLFIFHNFSNKYKGLEQINTKQKAKLFEFILENLLKKITNDKQKGLAIDNKIMNENFHIFVEIITLTKDLNRKVRNLAYEMIGNLTEFMQDLNLYYDWVKIILSVLASNSIYLKSAGINALARIFWQTRSEAGPVNLSIIMETFEIVLFFFKEANKEIIKSIYLFIRVLLYVLKTNFLKHEKTQLMVNKIVHYCFVDASKDIQKEFKVKNRNLLKTLILNFSFEEIKKISPKEIEDLLFYVNKHLVKKIKNITKEEEEIYGKNPDYSVLMDNDDLYLDEEEEFIDKEFKKVDKKKDDDELFLEKINKFNIYEDDPELIKKHNLAKANQEMNKKQDKIEELFNKDNVIKIFFRFLLINFFFRKCLLIVTLVFYFFNKKDV